MSATEKPLTDTYKSISAAAQGSYKDNGSKFLAFAFPVETEAQIKTHVDALKKTYFDARHHCYAYRLGHTGAQWRANDDGEPSSSAGRPILGQLLSNELSDILVVVVRYFGGIKLGIPGLIRAYKESTLDALQQATIVEKIAGTHYTIRFPYEGMNNVMKVLKDLSLEPTQQQYDLECSMQVRVRLRDESTFIERVTKAGAQIGPKDTSTPII